MRDEAPVKRMSLCDVIINIKNDHRKKLSWNTKYI